MLKGMGADIETDKEGFINIHPLKGHLKPLNITVPTDPSSAFFFCHCCCYYSKFKSFNKEFTLNPTRIGAYEVLKRMV